MFKSGNEYALKLSRLASGSDEIAKKAIFEGANIVADKISSNLQMNLCDPAYVGKGDGGFWDAKTSRPTGDLAESFGIAPIDLDSDGNWNTKLGFDGYDRKGVPNQLKARAMESGTSMLRKRPFVRPAVNATKNAAMAAMGKVIDEETEKIMSVT
jgi:hypothetical protein